jgi:MSHA biogenesis protein MshJ
MRARLLALVARFDALARRERLLIAAAVVVVIVFGGYSLFIDPAWQAARTDTQRGEQARNETTALNSQIDEIKRRPDPDVSNRAELEAVRKALAEGDAKLRALEATMVPPDKMRAFLESLLARHRAVQLVGLRTLAPAPLLESAGDAVAPAGPNIYKHGVEIRIAGQYSDLVAYLAELERMPQRILWNKVSLAVETYPRNVLTVTVYTLSLDKQWLIV